MIAIDDFAKRLGSIPEAEFTHKTVLDFLAANIVDPASLGPYLYFSREHYTRNLIHKTPLFELIAIGWDIGQKSPIHNHADQSCWMAMGHGKLQIHNFAVVNRDPERHYCELKSSGTVLLDRENPQEVDPNEPIHQVLNVPSFGSRAVSLHVYSRPYDTCEVYDLKSKSYSIMPLINTTEYGVVKTDLKLETLKL